MATDDQKNMTPEEVMELQKKNCIFCHIISGKVPAKKVFEDESVLGILDINPASPGHILLIPKRHVVIMPQMTDEEIGHIFTVAKHLSHTLIKNIKAKGTNIFVANGAIAGQKAPHMMVHVIPRNDDDRINLYPQNIEFSPDALETIRQKLLPRVRDTFKLDDQQMSKLGMKPSQPEQSVKQEHSDQHGLQEQQDTGQDESEKHEPAGHDDETADEKFDFEALDRVLKNGL